MVPESGTPRYIPDDEELRRMYEAAKSDKVATVRARTRRVIVTNGLTILLSVGLFGTHWRWLKHRSSSN